MARGDNNDNNDHHHHHKGWQWWQMGHERGAARTGTLMRSPPARSGSHDGAKGRDNKDEGHQCGRSKTETHKMTNNADRDRDRDNDSRTPSPCFV